MLGPKAIQLGYRGVYLACANAVLGLLNNSCYYLLPPLIDLSHAGFFKRLRSATSCAERRHRLS